MSSAPSTASPSGNRDFQITGPAYHEVAKATGLAMWEENVELGTIYRNRQWFEMLGYDAKEHSPITVWKDVLQLLHPDFYEVVEETHTRLVTGACRQTIEIVRLLNSNGDWVWVKTFLVVSRQDATGKALSIIGYDTNITDEQNLLSKLDIANRRNAALLEAVPDFLVIREEDGMASEVHTNDTDSPLSRTNELLGSNYEETFPPEVARLHREAAEAALRSGELSRLTYTLDTPEFGERIFEARYTPYGERCTASIIRDVTEISTTIRQIKKNKEEYERLLNALPVGVFSFIIDSNGEMKNLFLSDRVVTILKYPRSFLTQAAEAFATCFPEDDLEEWRQEWRRRFHKKEPIWQKEACCRTGDGQTIWVRFDLCRRELSKNRVRVDGSILDITAGKKAKKNIAQLKERLDETEKMRNLGELSASFVHDFNNQLESFQLFLDKLESDESLPQETRDYIPALHSRLRRNQNNIEKAMLFSRRQPMGSQKKRVDLTKVMGDAGDVFKLSLKNNKCTLVHKLPKKPLVISGDHSQIENAVLNLVINARDAMEEGGTVTLSLDSIILSKDASPPPFAHKLPPGSYARIRVRDTGCGMEADIMEQIFDQFFTTKPVGRGTGLGLPMVKRVAEAHNGTIGVRSKPGKGTEFTLLLLRSLSRKPSQETVQGEE